MVHFVGAGSGDPELITVKGARLLKSADIVIYTGSLINTELLDYCPQAEKYNSAYMDLEQVAQVYKENPDKDIVRLHTGDPCIFGAIREQMDILDELNIQYDYCAGVSSFCGAASALKTEYTLPNVSQSVIITRCEGRTPVPKGQSLKELAVHKATMVIFLSASLTEKVQRDLIEGGYSENTPCAIVYKATWSDEKVVRGQLLNLSDMAKENNITIFIVGHVTKEGTVAGPRVLEHMVDTVLYFEGDRYASYRILRSVKNRFGSTNEIGVFEMTDKGLREVSNPSEYMLSGKPEGASGSVVACTMEGTRPMLLEVQALVCRTNFGLPRRTAAGTDYNRLNLLMAVLEKRLNLPLSGYDAYVNIAGGVRLSEPAMDLALVLAVISSYKDVPVSDKTIVFGEVGLSGEVRAVSMAKQRVQEAKRLGFTKVILPKSSMDQVKDIKGIELIGVSAVWDAMKCL